MLLLLHISDPCVHCHFATHSIFMGKTFDTGILLTLLDKMLVLSSLCAVLSMMYRLACMFFREAKLADTYFDREVEQAFMTASKTIYQQKTLPYLLIAQRVGNMYTTSLYGGLVSYLIRSVFVLDIIY